MSLVGKSVFPNHIFIIGVALCCVTDSDKMHFLFSGQNVEKDIPSQSLSGKGLRGLKEEVTGQDGSSVKY